MSEADRDRKIEEFVERMGDFCDQTGQQRILGRVLGWLLVCDPPHQSLSAIAEAVSASKASISLTTRQLLHTGLLERMGLPGDRKTYYRLKKGAWSQMLERNFDHVSTMRRLAEGAMEIPGLSEDAEQRLDDMHSVYRFFEEEFPSLIERFEASRKKRRSA